MRRLARFRALAHEGDLSWSMGGTGCWSTGGTGQAFRANNQAGFPNPSQVYPDIPDARVRELAIRAHSRALTRSQKTDQDRERSNAMPHLFDLVKANLPRFRAGGPIYVPGLQGSLRPAGRHSATARGGQAFLCLRELLPRRLGAAVQA